MKNSLTRKALSFFLAVLMVFGVASTGLIVVAQQNDKEINYVSLGASNVNGYGMHGYLDEDVYEYPLLKENANIYGYKQDTPGSYPVLLKEFLEENGYDVNLAQLAISSMRAEEVRFLLDDSYKGDAYTDWRFCDVDGYTNRNSQNWFYLAGALEWAEQGNTTTPTQEQAVEALKAAYKKAIKEADLITVDIGVNNFGVYASNQIVSNMYENDMNTIDPELAAIYAEGKAFVMKVLEEEAGDLLDFMPVESLDHMADTMAYALVGFCLSFDAVMEQIYTLNPNATVAVVSIQNLMYGLYATMEGIEAPLPFGEIFGALVNAANVYTATISPYCDKYVYADVRANGHVEFFSDEILAYNGDPATLSQDMKDCFDVYDNDLYIKTRVQQLLAKQLYAAQLLDISAAQALGADIANNLEHFAIAYQNKLLNIPALGITFNEFFVKGAAGDLAGTPAQPYYDGYVVALNTAYDVMAEIMQEGVKIDTLDAASFGANFGPVEDGLLGAFFGTLEQAVMAALADSTFEFDLNDYYPDGIFKTLAAESGLPEGFVNTVAALGIRTGIGNSFYGHPNGNGQVQLMNAIVAALKNKTTGKDVVKNEILIGLEPAIKYFEALGLELLGTLKNLEPVAEGLAVELEVLYGQLEEKIEALGEKLADLTEKEEVILKDMLAEREALVNELEALEEELAGIYAEPVSAAGLPTKKMSATTVADTAEELEAELEAAIAETKAAIEELDAAIIYVKNQIETDKSGIEAIEAAIEAIKTNIAKTEAALAEVNAAIITLTADLAELSEALEVLGEASKALYDLTAGKIDADKVYEAVKTVIETLPAVVDTLKNIYGEAVEAIEKAQAAVEAIKASAEIIKTNVENLIDSAEKLAAIEGEKAEALKATAKEIYDLAEAFVIDNLPTVEAALKVTAGEIEGIIKREIAKAEALWVEYEDVVMGALSVVYFYCEEKGYIDLAKEYVENQKLVIKGELENLKGCLENAEIELEAKLEELKKLLEEKYPEVVKELEDLKAELEGTVDAEARAVLEALIEKLEAKKAALEAKIEEAKIVVAKIKAYIEAVKAAIEEVEKALDDVCEKLEVVATDIEAVIEALCALKGTLCDLGNSVCDLNTAIKDEVLKLLGYANLVGEKVLAVVDTLDTYADLFVDGVVIVKNEIIEAIEEAIYNATHADYVKGSDSYYVAFGDSTAVSESYVDLLAKELGVKFNNLAQAGLKVEDMFDIIGVNIAEIKKADLITVGFGNNAFITEAINNALDYEEAPEYDWAKYVGEDGAEYVAQALAELKAMLDEEGLGELAGVPVSELAVVAIESYAYSCVAYAVNLPAVANAISEINPEALVILVGMYNPLDGVVIDLGETELDISEYLDYLAQAAGLESLIYAIVTGDAIYVDAPDVETKLTDDALSLIDIMQEFGMEQGANLDPSAAGHEYIKNQILDALNIVKEAEKLLGDANSDGKVNSLDATYILRYDVELIGADKIDLTLADVNGDGKVNSIDAMYVLRYDAELIEKFPAEDKAA